jgi:hypothetical protein
MSRDNNEIFGQPIHPSMPRRDVMKEDFGWEVPVETVPLPSRGVIYPKGSYFHNRETVDIRAMTAREEDILTSRALVKKGTIINELIRSCISDRGVDPQDLVSGDRNALMVAIRITGYGSEYRVEASCEKCGHRGPQTFDLGGLSIKRLEVEPAIPNENRFTFDLPVTKKRVTFKILTGRDQEEIAAHAAKMRSVLPDSPDTAITSFIERSIVAVGDVTERTKISMFVKNMPAQDSRLLRKHVREIEPGIDLTCDMTCISCGEASRVEMPIGPTFLWPDA